MKRPFLLALLLALFGTLAACANPSVVTLNDGRQIQTLDTPEYIDDEDVYEYEQLDGKPGRVNKDQVRKIEEL